MADQLIQVVAFTSVAAAGTVSLPHNINIAGVPQTPDFVAANTAGFTVTASSTEVTVTNNNDAPANVSVWLELKHSIQRAFGGAQNTSLSPRPFVASGGGTGGGGGGSPLFPIDPTVHDGDFTATALFVNLVSTLLVNPTVTLPPAASVSNGDWCVVKKFLGDAGESSVAVAPSGGDTISGDVNYIPARSSGLYVSDGVDTWVVVAAFVN